MISPNHKSAARQGADHGVVPAGTEIGGAGAAWRLVAPCESRGERSCWRPHSHLFPKAALGMGTGEACSDPMAMRGPEGLRGFPWSWLDPEHPPALLSFVHRQ